MSSNLKELKVLFALQNRGAQIDYRSIVDDVLELGSQFMRLAAGFLKKLRELISYTLEFILLADEPESKPHLQLPRVQYCVRPKDVS